MNPMWAGIQRDGGAIAVTVNRAKLSGEELGVIKMKGRDV